METPTILSADPIAETVLDILTGADYHNLRDLANTIADAVRPALALTRDDAQVLNDFIPTAVRAIGANRLSTRTQRSLCSLQLRCSASLSAR